MVEKWENLCRALLMLLGDQPPRQLDAVYLHGLSEGMVASFDLFRVVTEATFATGAILSFNGSDGRGTGSDKANPGAAWPGSQWYKAEFNKRGVHFNATRPGLHSRDEIDAFVELAKTKAWKNVGITTVPYHFPRSFICLIAAMKEQGHRMSAYAISPQVPTEQWWIPMMGSQNLTQTIAFEECVADFRRVFDYQNKRFGAEFEDLFSYLRRRNTTDEKTRGQPLTLDKDD